MSRKNLLSSLNGTAKPDQPSAPPPFSRPHLDAAKSKPMAAVTRSLGDLNERSRRANEIERKLAEGQSVVELDTAAIEPSFVRDRMPGDVDGLRASIRDQGQQVPILVRPHPDEPGRYQVAFGHRRLRVVSDLGLPVKAIVREMTDEQLVIAQGQENNEREDLTFIEKARFAARLKDRFSRETIISAMSVDKADLSRMLSLVESLPAELIDAIGPAPGVGRGGWQQLADLLDKTPALPEALRFAMSDAVQDLPSADRVKAMIAQLKPRRVERGAPGILSTPTGTRLALVKDGRGKLEISIDKKATPEFATFVLELLPGLFAEHQAEKLKKKEA
ncbi:plasmid partitioning protein RepB [Rhizobium sp. 18065]|uniref:plasmid partitioning protein RepB n=1 Tax=Rhizobium sp. 18065 TaxID=2681411 RepID=UPI00135ABE48|nr:plasmid partitioning protein RepB [Rhizobium sp. 18065]